MYRLVIKAQNGDGTAQKSKEALMWFNLAVANGNEEAKGYRDKVAGMMTPADISEAQQMASDWMKVHP